MVTATDPSPTDNAHEFSVAELSRELKLAVEDRFGSVRLRGEISGWKVPASGHAYFTLKDEGAVIDAVMWRGQRGRLDFAPEDGLEVVASGKVTTYAGRSKYQIVVDRMRVAGAGALMALLEKRKTALAAEGLFAAERKRPLPYLPRTIGIVTSPTGAVIRDMLHRLADRFPRDVLLWPVRVQGEGAAEEVAAAIAGMNALADPPDLLIVARGGGSIEDLWAFNEEAVVRAIAASDIPVISAVGHETDTTLADLAADHRAPTPTAAAEAAVPVRANLRAGIADLAARLERGGARATGQRAERAAMVAARLPAPQALLAARQQRFDDLGARLPPPLVILERRRERLATITARLPRALSTAADRAAIRLGSVAGRLSPTLATRRIEQEEAAATRAAAALRRGALNRLTTFSQTVAAAGRVLASLDPRGPLARGFALVETSGGRVVTAAATATAEAALKLRFADGDVDVVVDGAAAPSPAPVLTSTSLSASPVPAAKRRRKPPPAAGQSDLFGSGPNE
ncbi:MAG: exodeoxyribonuclease VII large subunit [Pseudomonadota bacterium]